jgi:hypothetical protein
MEKTSFDTTGVGSALEDCQLPGVLLFLPFVMQRKRGNLGFLSCIKAYQ